jgi:hypothetical protein
MCCRVSGGAGIHAGEPEAGRKLAEREKEMLMSELLVTTMQEDRGVLGR